VGCGGDNPTAVRGVVQIAGVTSNANTVQCGVYDPHAPIDSLYLASPDTLYFYAHMVNTTASDVSVTSMQAAGTVTHASDSTVIGGFAFTFTALAFTPQPSLLQAHTGDLTVTIAMRVVALCADNPLRLSYKDVATSLRVITSAGMYVSLPINVRFNYLGGIGHPTLVAGS
jgi:hypothetical protein